MDQPVLSLRKIGKTFPGVRALNGVSIDFYKGEVHGIVGENGAGKSTLMKILSGVYTLEEGEIYIDGQKVDIRNPMDSLNLGQSIIFQEFNLIDALSIAENIYLGRLSRKKGKPIDWKQVNAQAKALMREVGYDIDPRMLIRDLSVAQKQMVEIAKALSFNARIIIMDEPSATLTTKEVENLFRIVRSLKEKGVSVIYISHKLEEVFEICDRVSVMRDGNLISTKGIAEVTRRGIIEDMVGRKVEQEYPPREKKPADDAPIVLEARNLKREGVFENISFKLRRGEVLGFAGLVGSGRTEIMRAVFGADKLDAGEVFINGAPVRIKTPDDSIAHHLAFLTEDRKQQGLFLNMSVKDNISFVYAPRITNVLGLINRNKEEEACRQQIEKLTVKTPTMRQLVKNLSGGNQQKGYYSQSI